MDNITTENLFLLEFLVDTVTLDPKCECDAPAGETCVSFQFLDNAPLDVCEADFVPKRRIRNGTDSVKSGKSCLFSLSPEQANNAIEQFDVFVCIMKKMKPGWLPERIDIGGSIISICDLFNELINSVEMSDGSTPTAKTLKDSFDISNAEGKTIGKIGVYIRMSCFGKLIVTQFQMNLDDKTVLFKDKEGKSLYRYKKAGKGKSKEGVGQQRQCNFNCPTVPCQHDVPNLRSNTECPLVSCPQYDNKIGSDPPASAPLPYHLPYSHPAGLPNQPPSGWGLESPRAGITPCPECGSIPNPPCLMPQEYPQRGTPCNECGTALVPADFLAPQRTPAAGVPCNECEYVQRPPCLERTQCPLDGNYQEIGASMGGNSLTIRLHKDKSKIEQVHPDEEGRPLAKPQAFDIRPGAPPDRPFSIKVGQQGEGAGGDNGVVVNPPVYTTADGAQFTEFSDPNKEMFVLRIGKKSEGADRKQNLELELQTPKAPPLKPIPQKKSVETQYESENEVRNNTRGGMTTPAKKGETGRKGKGGKKKK
ncbi:uncharacterized protein LOC132698197 [Cylas formicarius]|uniref:uncharacterized protein LOC132698197 n=1 Tax=Cylas formicarius TaxID=197179 RepID=UPI002958C4D5|nr:uncharacterized protein LOC132698197 [Cylas formicarius]